MAGIHMLSAGKVEAEYKRKIKKPKRFHDGGGLYLQVARSGAVSWVYRFQVKDVTGKRRFRDMGLGALHKAGIDKPGEDVFGVSLKKAREKAALMRAMVSDGKDPIDEKAKAGKSGQTFRQHFDVMEQRGPHPGWRSMLDTHAMPVIGDKLVEQITTDDIADIIAKLHKAGKFETARKLQIRINAVMKSALGKIDTPAHQHYISLKVRDFKYGRKNKPFASLDFDKLPAFVRDLQKREAVEALALEFVILTVCRTGDVTGSRKRYGKNKPPLRWEHILGDKVWMIPAIKTADDHNPEPFAIPLSDAARDVLARARKLNPKSDIVFPIWRNGQFQQLAENGMRDQIGVIKDRKRVRPDCTVHGMRTAFRTWAGEKTSAERDLIETVLAHKVFSKDKAEAPYKSKTAFFDKRKALMQRWADYITAKRKVVPFKHRAAA